MVAIQLAKKVCLIVIICPESDWNPALSGQIEIIAQQHGLSFQCITLVGDFRDIGQLFRLVNIVDTIDRGDQLCHVNPILHAVIEIQSRIAVFAHDPFYRALDHHIVQLLSIIYGVVRGDRVAVFKCVICFL